MHQGYGPVNYMGDIGLLVNQVAADPLILKKNDLFVIPSISPSWKAEDVWNTGIVSTYGNSLHALSFERCVGLLVFVLTSMTNSRLLIQVPE